MRILLRDAFDSEVTHEFDADIDESKIGPAMAESLGQMKKDRGEDSRPEAYELACEALSTLISSDDERRIEERHPKVDGNSQVYIDVLSGEFADMLCAAADMALQEAEGIHLN